MMRRRSAIVKFEGELWHACVFQKAADSKETLNRWQEDELAYLQESFIVEPMPEELRPLMNQALEEWKIREDKVLSKLGMDRREFMHRFQEARESLWRGGFRWPLFALGVGDRVYGVVLNMDWVNLFGWILPRADKANEKQHRERGRLVTALFYSELMLRYVGNPEHRDLVRIEARWVLANEGGDNGQV